MRKIFFMLMLGFLVLGVLTAQSRQTLQVMDFSGGAGNDGRNIAAMLANQDIIRNNFSLVSQGSRAEFVISCEIRRERIGYTVDIVITQTSNNSERGRQSLYYRDIVEVAAFMPSVAGNLARTAVPRISAAEAAAADLVPLPVYAGPAPQQVEQPAPRQPARAAPRQQAEPRTPRQPAEPRQPPRTPREPRQPAEAREESAEIDDAWRNKVFYTGLALGYSFAGDGGVSFAVQADLRPFSQRARWLGFRLGWGTASFDTGWNLVYNQGGTNYSGEFDGTKQNGYFFLTPTATIPLGRFDLILYLGLAMSIFDQHEVDFDYMPGPIASRGSVFTAGPYTGMDLGTKLGPGMLFLTFNVCFMAGGKEPEHLGMNSYEGHRMNGAFGINLALGYRIGFGNKRPKE